MFMILATLLLVLSPYTAVIPGVYAAAGVLTQKYRIHFNPWNIGLLLLFIISVFSGILNKSPLSILGSLLILMYFCVSIAVEDSFNLREQIIRLYLYLLYGSLIPGIIGIAEKIAIEAYDITLIKRFLCLTSDADLNNRVYSTFVNPNIAGSWFAAMILISIFFWDKASYIKKARLIPMLLLYCTSLLLTGSRGAIMGLAAAITVYVVMKKGIKKLTIPICILGIILLLSVLPISSSFMGNIMGHKISSSFTTRYPIWNGCIEMIKNKPLTGWGVMGVYEKGSAFINKDSSVAHAHNIYLAILTSFGFIGFYVFIIMKLYLVSGLAALYKSSCPLTPLLAAMQVLVIVHGLVDFTIAAPQVGMLYISSCAFIVSLARNLSTNPQCHKVPSWSVEVFPKYRAD